MTLPYDIARCAGERNRSGTMLHQCSRCARQIYSKPADCHPYVQPWRDPHHAALLDSLADQVVTAIGVAHCAGMDFPGALAEVNRSNWSKFENGAPVFLTGGKIGKGEFYTPPNLTDFV